MEEQANSVIIAPYHLEPYLLEELKGLSFSQKGRAFILYEELDRDIFFKDQVWKSPQIISIDSIKDATKKLKSLNNKWANYSFQLHRRAKLINESLRSKEIPRLNFLEKPHDLQWGEWLLLDNNNIIYSLENEKQYPLGRYEFNENKTFPPSRAYLKLWELFTVYGIKPNKEDVCLDLGACPGGWTWVLSNLPSKVISVDKADLDKSVSSLKDVSFIKSDAFELNPKDLPKADWLFSDIACYPDKLFTLVQKWLDSDIKNFICTIKLKGHPNLTKTLEPFLSIKGSKVLHLYQNKHELTWIYQR